MFVHLAARTCYSLRDAVLRPQELAEATTVRGMAAVGVADRGGLYGAVRVAQACAVTGVRPLFGADVALGGRNGARVVLLARHRAGFANLCRLITDHHLESARGDPQATWEQLSRRCAGLFALLGDDSPVARLLDAGQLDAAAAEARRWMELFGPSSVLVGVTHHLAAGDDQRARRRFGLAERLGLRAVANQAPRYLDRADARVADVMDAVRQQVPLAQRHAQRRNAEGYLKTPAQMAQVFAERPDALTNTAWVAERCDVDLRLGQLHVPDYVALGDAAQAELRARAEAGVRERYAAPGRQHHDLLERELTMVARLGLAPYFLTVAEIVARIREKGIMAACRGSAAGSLVCYALRISDVDPVAHDLCFERFMNPFRDELPDIDVDVESARREDIYRDLLDRYGSERVACVAMVERFKARMAIREVGKALGLPAGEVDVIAKAFPHIRARDVRAALAQLPELADRGLHRADLQLLFDVVERLDELPRHLALHPSGVLLCDATLRDFVPLERSANGFAMAQYDKDDVEALGLCKLDILGVRMLSAMAHCVEEVRRVRGVEVDLAAVPWDDEDTFELIRSTRTLGMFQIESPGQRELIGRFQPEHLGDLVVDISLFRPGPVKGDMVGPFLQRRLGQARTVIPHPLLERALGETYGVIVYHEQVMRCVAAVTGCDLSTADLVRRRLGDEEKLPELSAWFFAGAAARGIGEDVARSLWHALAQFASFGFCKAHAAAFAVPTYRSAWLKTHYLPEFVAGLLTHDPGMYPRRLLLEEARQFGVAVLPLDVNRSARAYRVERLPEAGYGIRLALQDVAGITDEMTESLLAGRPFTSVEDLRRRAALSAPVAGSLARAGALDEIGGVLARRQTRRDLLLQVTERWSELTRHRVADPRQPEQLSLLGDPGPAGLREYRASERVRAELEVLGVDASTHVMRFYEGLLDVLGVTRAGDLLAQRGGQRVRVAGVKVATQTPPVKSGQRVIFLSLDDATGVSDVTFFEAVHDRCAWTVFHGWLLVVEGSVHRSGVRGVSLNAERAWDLSRLMRAWREDRLDAALRERGGPEGPAGGRAQVRERGGPEGPAGGPVRKLWHASGGSSGR